MYFQVQKKQDKRLSVVPIIKPKHALASRLTGYRWLLLSSSHPTPYPKLPHRMGTPPPLSVLYTPAILSRHSLGLFLMVPSLGVSSLPLFPFLSPLSRPRSLCWPRSVDDFPYSRFFQTPLAACSLIATIKPSPPPHLGAVASSP